MTLDELLKAANDGSLELQYVVGLCFSNGFGVEVNKAVAEQWFCRSAEEGYAPSQ